MAGIIAKSSIESVRFQSDIAEVVGSYLTLKRAGSALKTLCPFHKEKTPSFTVNTERQIFHCFGCGEGGDVFKFVMKYEGVEFGEAVTLLAKRGGVSLVYEQGTGGGGEDRSALYDILEQAAQFYQRVLLGSKAGEAALAYLHKREVADEIAREFMIGCAPNRWDAILTWGRKHKHSNAKLEEAGMIIKSPKAGAGYYDRFRDRITFPIRDTQGRVIGFSARAMAGDTEGAKYVNTPETPVFHKSRVLYGLYRARRHMVEKSEAIVCEGQLDVIRCHQVGFDNAVAPQGTAFTEDHARIIKRSSDAAVVVFDSDTAGQNAALKAAMVLMHSGLAVRVATLPKGEDPDSFIRANGADAFGAILSEARQTMHFQVQLLGEREDLSSELGLMRASKAVLETIAQTPNAVQRSSLIQQAAELLNLPPNALEEELRRVRTRRATARAADSQGKPIEHPREEVELASHIVTSPGLGELVENYLPPAMITDWHCSTIIGCARKASHEGRDIMSMVAEQDRPDGELSRLTAQMQVAPSKAVGPDATAEDAVKGLILFIRRRQLKREQAQLFASLDSTQGEAHEDARIKLSEVTHDLKLLKNWSMALPIMEIDGLDAEE